MSDQLATVVGDLMTRVVALEPLAYPTSTARNLWIYWSQATPYWCNRVARVTVDGPEDLPTYTVAIQMRLVLSHQQGISREDGVATNPQVAAVSAIPSVLRYFERHRDLAPPGVDDEGDALYPALTHLDGALTRIACARGLDLAVLPLSREIVLVTDFELTVPITVGQEE